MPSLVITVTSEVIQHANDIIQKGRGHMVLAHRQGRWEFVPKAGEMLDWAASKFPPSPDQPVHGAILRRDGGGTDEPTE